VNETSVESTAQDDFQEVKRRKRHISNNTSQTAKNSTKPVTTSAAVKTPPKAALTRNFFSSLRTTGMDTETTDAENTVPEQEATRKPGRPPPIVMTSTTNLIPPPNDLKDRVKGQHEFRNTLYGTHITTNEIADYSAMKSYLEKNNLHYFIFSPNSEKTIKAVSNPSPSPRHASRRYFQQP
jgi:hypothetical protein